MPHIDLSTLNRLQLRRLLEAARNDGDADLANLIVQETARRERGSLSPEPEPIALPARETARAGRRRAWLAPMFAVGLALGVGLGWWAGGQWRVRKPSAGAPYRAAVALAPALSTPPSVPPAPTAAALAASAPAPAEVPAKRPDVIAGLLVGAAPARPPPQAPGCEAAAGPADRAICADPALQALDRELAAAYAQALDAHHAHRELLRERQAAWQAARNDIADPDRLARLYEARIRALKAATAAARRP